MRVRHTFWGVITEKLQESKEFYVTHLGFRVLYELEWYLHLASEGGTCELGFLAPHHSTQPPIFQEPFLGGGAWLSLEVDDAEEEYNRLRRAQLIMALPLTDEPWGERHFALADPSGMPINIYSRIPPSEEFSQGTESPPAI